MTGIIFDIKRFALHDGPGIRTTVFFKGCSMRCLWCHNPESQKEECEKTVRDLPLGMLRYSETFTIGSAMSVDEVMKEVASDRIFYEESGGGVTFSGGEPLLQPEFLKSLARTCRENGIHTVLDTSGYASEDVFDRLAGEFDLFHYDIKLIDPERHRLNTGVPNDLILRNLRTLAKGTTGVVIRFPVIPTYTDDQENVIAIADLLHSLHRPFRVDLISFHSFARHKYLRLNRAEPYLQIPPSDNQRMKEIQAYFQERGFSVTTGG